MMQSINHEYNCLLNRQEILRAPNSLGNPKMHNV